MNSIPQSRQIDECGHKRSKPRSRAHSATATGGLGLDEILGGGLPEYSFNILAGAPGSGKTTLAHQIMFANATPERPAIYFAIVKEVEASNPGVVMVDSRLPRPDQRHPRAVVE